MTNGKRAKYERCVLKVKEKLPKKCLKKKAWGKRINGKMCYNPWAVCTKTVGRSKSKYGKKRSKRKRKIHTGPRGGRYYICKGRKVYV